jgi:uncharacterized protein YfaS (alpha-2-macroglobulin family)
MDEVTITAAQGPRRYGLLEVPLPPGASVESTTWGISLPGADGKLEGLERARHQPTAFGYAVPVDPIAGVQRIRHLLRFAERGSFSMPRARLFAMYRPDAKAFEAGPPTRNLQVQ